jgi:GNAT superfamily N-acetyltransferase
VFSVSYHSGFPWCEEVKNSRARHHEVETMIRPAEPGDTPTLVALADHTGVFKPMEIEALKEVLDDFHVGEHPHGRCIVYEQDGQPIGFAYYAPAAMTDRTWQLWWIAVKKDIHARGIGSKLLHFVEDDIRRQNGRQILIETGSLPHYEPTRRFYTKHQYEQAGFQPDYYADGDHMMIFRKRM